MRTAYHPTAQPTTSWSVFTSTLATPFNDPIAESIDEYQAFLKTLGYSPLAQGAFGKEISTS
jgi:hypothetical protein